MAIPAAETAASRYNRKWVQIKDDRKVRGLDKQDQERKDRLFVDENGDSAVS